MFEVTDYFYCVFLDPQATIMQSEKNLEEFFKKYLPVSYINRKPN